MECEEVILMMSLLFGRKTAMTFYAASIFFEVLLQFGELPPDVSYIPATRPALGFGQFRACRRVLAFSMLVTYQCF